VCACAVCFKFLNERKKREKRVPAAVLGKLERKRRDNTRQMSLWWKTGTRYASKSQRKDSERKSRERGAKEWRAAKYWCVVVTGVELVWPV
jgi:hypothetical protein